MVFLVRQVDNGGLVVICVFGRFGLLRCWLRVRIRCLLGLGFLVLFLLLRLRIRLRGLGAFEGIFVCCLGFCVLRVSLR